MTAFIKKKFHQPHISGRTYSRLDCRDEAESNASTRAKRSGRVPPGWTRTSRGAWIKSSWRRRCGKTTSCARDCARTPPSHSPKATARSSIHPSSLHPSVHSRTHSTHPGYSIEFSRGAQLMRHTRGCVCTVVRRTSAGEGSFGKQRESVRRSQLLARRPGGNMGGVV